MNKIRDAILWLAADYRLKRDKPFIIGIGGAIAKTSTKEAVGVVMREAFPNQVYVSHGNLNTYVGVPLSLMGYEIDFHQQRITWQWLFILLGTLWRMFFRHLPKYAVVELGTDHPGDLHALLQHIRPTIGLLTIVGSAHLENYESERAIAEEESSLIAALPPDGLAIVNKQDPYLELHRQNARCSVIEADCGLEEIAFEYAKIIGNYFKLPKVLIEKSLANMHQPLRRFNKMEIGGHVILDDSYNANPLSMKAALNILKRLPNRRIAVLGTMLELGPTERQLHEEIGRLAHESADLIIGVGRLADAYQPDHQFANSHAAAEAIFSYLVEGDSILIKGSRGVHMEVIMEKLEEKLS